MTPNASLDARHLASAPVVVGVDGGPVSEAAIGVAFEKAALIQHARCPVMVVHPQS